MVRSVIYSMNNAPKKINHKEYTLSNTPEKTIEAIMQSYERIKRYWIIWALMITMLQSCSPDSTVKIHDAWIPQVPPNAIYMAGFMTIDNHSSQPKTIKAVSGSLVERIEIHRTKYDKKSGFASMVRQTQLTIAANSSLKFEPGGYHLMLIQPKKSFQTGDSVTLTFSFNDGMESVGEFIVR